MSNPYDYAIDPEGCDTANKVLRWVGEGRRVLELGTAAGVMTRELHRQDCRVTGIEFVAEMAAKAEPWCERMVVADLETVDFAPFFADGAFDTIVAADVLEHLRNPEAVLDKLRLQAGVQTELIVSVPNVAYAGLVAGLVRGEFRYREKGLLDQTHVRFFTRSSLEWMLLRSGWMALEWDAHRVPVERSEFFGDWVSLDPGSREAIAQKPDSDAYQFLVRARPASESAIAERLRREADVLEGRLQALQCDYDARVARHEEDLAALKEHQKAFAEARVLLETLQREKSPSWLDPRDRRLLPALARQLYRLAVRLGGP